MKLQLILKLYDALVSGQKIIRADFCVANDITERTFYRYMHEIGTFLRNYRKDCIIDVVDFAGVYFLKKYSPTDTH